jgi:23S rRNA pseudouridine2605 synthase
MPGFFHFMRLNRFLSQCGLGSRRGCEQLILEGRVVINGHRISELGILVKDEDEVTVDGKPARLSAQVVIALHKPRGYICSRSDERDRETIYALLPGPFQRLHHIGRLDKDSDGLILLTNRGELSHRLIHPSMGAEKEYEVIVDQPLDQAVMAKLVKGMMTEEGYAKAERAWMITEYRCRMILKQGLKRQIRLMFYQLGFEVERLTRTRIGWLELRGLPKGAWRQLTDTEIQRFFSEAGTTGRAQPRGVKSAPEADEAESAINLEEEGWEKPKPRTPARKTAKGKFQAAKRPAGKPAMRTRPERSERPEPRSSFAKPSGRPSGPKKEARSGGNRSNFQAKKGRSKPR